jgi:hypothetical protein
MVAWVWVAVAALVVVALQAFLFHRARRNWGVDGEGGQRQRGATDAVSTADGLERVADGVRCPHCGEVNRDSFTFCQRCVQRVQ